MATYLETFLNHIDLIKYKELLHGQGYKEEIDIFLLNEMDLNNVHIMDPTDRNTILNAVSQIDISLWLKYYSLSQYERHFRDLQIKTIGDLKETMICDDVMDELEVMVPGDRKRLAMAAKHICLPVPAEPDQLVSIAKQPVARGYWGKNDAVPTHTTDFLWVNDCFIKSNIPGHEPVKLLDCLVDTASEVVTVKEDISSELNLAFVKTFLSQGIHNAKEQRLYRGILLLGTKEITVDVMFDSYNSVGCNMFQKFTHFIDGSNHLWFDSDS